MKIYPNEASANLNTLLLDNKTYVTASIKNPLTSKNSEAAKLGEKALNCQAPVPDDVMQVDGIMVTASWNLNDDVFSSEEIWSSRYTPISKPVNQNHQGKENAEKNTILGVITSSYAVNTEFEYLDVADDQLPDKFHLLVRTWVWKNYFPEATTSIKRKIEENKQFFSMECFFEDFGYALRTDKGGSVSILPRTEVTSWLTRSLRSYGGTGKVTINGVNYQIGRWLRNINFSGVSFVDTPADVEAIVFQDYLDNSEASAKFSEISQSVSENGVLLNSPSQDNKDQIMAAKKPEVTQADEIVTETVVTPQVVDPNIALNEKITLLEETVATLTKALEASTAKVSEAEAKIKECNDIMAKNAKDMKAKDRFAKMKEAGASAFVADKEEDALAALAAMEDSSFEILLKTASALSKSATALSNLPKLTDQTFSNQPKLTDQTFSNQPKLTEAEAKTQLDSAVAENDTNLATLAAAGKETNESKAALDTFMSAALDLNKNKNKKVKQSA